MNEPQPHTELIPLTVGEILDRSFRLLPVTVKNLWLLCLTVALFAPLPLYFESRGETLLKLASIALSVVAYCFILPFVILICDQAWLEGKGDMKRARKRYSFMLIPQMFLLWLWTTIMFTLGIILLIIPGFVYIANRFLSFYILVIEGGGVENALRRSKYLMTKGKWYSFHGPLARLSGIGVVALLVGIMGSVINSAGSVVFAFSNHNPEMLLLALVLSFVGTFLYYLLSLFTLTVYVGFYYDLRVRYEGIDLLHEPATDSTPNSNTL